MNVEPDSRAALILPFLKDNPFEDYTLVDTQILPSHQDEICIKHLGFYKQTGIMVEIER